MPTSMVESAPAIVPSARRRDDDGDLARALRIEDERVLERTGLVGAGADPAGAAVIQQSDRDRAVRPRALARGQPARVRPARESPATDLVAAGVSSVTSVIAPPSVVSTAAGLAVVHDRSPTATAGVIGGTERDAAGTAGASRFRDAIESLARVAQRSRGDSAARGRRTRCRVRLTNCRAPPPEIDRSGAISVPTLMSE